MKFQLLITTLFCVTVCFSQSSTKLVIVGEVHDAATNAPLAYATIGIKNRVEQTVSGADGKFELSVPSAWHSDTLFVTYIGYQKFEKAINKLASVEQVLLKEMPTLLEEVTVVHNPLDLREVDKNIRIIRGNLYAMASEVTNAEYNTFLASLDDYNKKEQRKKFDFDLSRYDQSVRSFYTRYHKPAKELRKSRRDTLNGYSHYPAVNISHEAAIEYCKWLTDQYNENPKKKKFKKVLFRLPTLKEWQIAALGYDKFQSWNILENTVEVIITKDSMALDMLKGEKKTVKVDETFLYPWYYPWHFRNKPQNSRNCFLGNFRVDRAIPCPANAHAYDGWSMMARVASYFPNNIGLYDVAGNIAEMIDEKGKACGGSWKEYPAQSTIQSVKDFSGPDETVGFRVFMEVIEK
jgi:formylglycine-generating enzyme required for sulfatase activity